MNDVQADPKLVDRLLDVSIRHAEGRHKTVHCLTPDCSHWWFIEPEQENTMIFCYVIINSIIDDCCFIRMFVCLFCRDVNIGFV